MTTLSLRLPDSLHRQVKELARREGISINQLLTTAAAEKISALATEEYLMGRAAQGDRGSYRKILAMVPDAEPREGD